MKHEIPQNTDNRFNGKPSDTTGNSWNPIRTAYNIATGMTVNKALAGVAILLQFADVAKSATILREAASTKGINPHSQDVTTKTHGVSSPSSTVAGELKLNYPTTTETSDPYSTEASHFLDKTHQKVFGEKARKTSEEEIYTPGAHKLKKELAQEKTINNPARQYNGEKVLDDFHGQEVKKTSERSGDEERNKKMERRMKINEQKAEAEEQRKFAAEVDKIVSRMDPETQWSVASCFKKALGPEAAENIKDFTSDPAVREYTIGCIQSATQETWDQVSRIYENPKAMAKFNKWLERSGALEELKAAIDYYAEQNSTPTSSQDIVKRLVATKTDKVASPTRAITDSTSPVCYGGVCDKGNKDASDPISNGTFCNDAYNAGFSTGALLSLLGVVTAAAGFWAARSGQREYKKITLEMVNKWGDKEQEDGVGKDHKVGSCSQSGKYVDFDALAEIYRVVDPATRATNGRITVLRNPQLQIPAAWSWELEETKAMVVIRPKNPAGDDRAANNPHRTPRSMYIMNCMKNFWCCCCKNKP